MMDMKWQPIETAPKDGREIVGMWKWGNVQHVVMIWKGSRWCEKFNYNTEFKPTHWMPLPPPPPLPTE